MRISIMKREQKREPSNGTRCAQGLPSYGARCALGQPSCGRATRHTKTLDTPKLVARKSPGQPKLLGASCTGANCTEASYTGA